MYEHKAVVLGTNYYIGLGVVRALGMKGVWVTTVDYEPSHYGVSKFVKERLIAPHYKKEEQACVKFLIDYAKKQKAKPVLFPTADLYVDFMEDNYDALKEYYLWPNDQKGLYKAIMDKASLLQFTEKYQIKTPEILPMDTPDLYPRVTKEFGYPCIIKPAESMPFVNAYRTKVFRVENEKQLREKMEMIKRDGFYVFVQRIIPGPEENCYSFDVYMDRHNEAAAYMTTCKIRQWPINFGASTYAKQKYIPELYDLCMPLFQGIQYRGFAEVELKRDVNTGTIYLMEINVRFVNFVWLQVQMGMNTPMMYYLDCLGEEVSGAKIAEDKEVYWKYEYEDISAIRAYLRTGQMTWGKIIGDYRLKKVCSTWWSKDPGPGWSFFKWAVGHKLKG